MFWLLLVIASFIWYGTYYWKMRRLYSLAKQIPQTKLMSYPIIGMCHWFHGNSEVHIDTLNRLGKDAVEQGGITSAWMVNKLYAVVADPEVADVVLKSCLDKDDTTMKFIRKYLGNGNIFAPVHIWRPRRKVLAPVFSIKNLNSFVPEFERQAIKLSKKLEERVGDGDFSLWNFINTYTFDAICKNSLGIDLNSQDNNYHPFLEAFEIASRITGRRLIRPWLYWDFVYELVARQEHKEFVHARDVTYNFLNDLIQLKRKQIAERNKSDDAKSDIGISFLNILMGSAAKGYTDVELREETNVIIAAGSDTSAVATCFTAVMLSRYPEIQEKVYREIQEVFGDTDRPITPSDFPSLVYLEAVIKETMRLYPAAPVFVREVFNDVKLPTGQTLVYGTGILIDLHGMHRNPKYWGNDTEVFRPERFLEGPLKHPCQYIPFSYSMRNCLGGTYAMMSMKTALVMILRKYRVLPPAGLSPEELKKPLRVQFNIMLRHVDNYTVRLEYRNKRDLRKVYV